MCVVSTPRGTQGKGGLTYGSMRVRVRAAEGPAWRPVGMLVLGVYSKESSAGNQALAEGVGGASGMWRRLVNMDIPGIPVLGSTQGLGACGRVGPGISQ